MGACYKSAQLIQLITSINKILENISIIMKIIIVIEAIVLIINNKVGVKIKYVRFKRKMKKLYLLYNNNKNSSNKASNRRMMTIKKIPEFCRVVYILLSSPRRI